MKHVQIRNVPAQTHRALRRRADEAGMSLQEYLLAALKALAIQPTVDEVLGRRHAGGRIGLGAATAHLRTERSRH